MKVLAIDPGNTESAYVLMDMDYNIHKFDKITNEEMRQVIIDNEAENMVAKRKGKTVTVIEMIASYGMAVGQTVFDTCVWVGRFTELAGDVEYMFRKDVKMNICGQTRAKDTNIRVALIDRFARHNFKTGKGTKDNPDYFYGFRADVWAAFAVGVTYIDGQKKI